MSTPRVARLASSNSLRRWWARLMLTAPVSSRWILRLMLGGASALPLGLTWYNPFWLRYAVGLFVLLFVITAWQQWAGWSRLGSWLTAAVVLAIFWGSMSLIWLFLESSWSRVLLLAVTVFFTWWYLREWHRLRLTLFLGEAGAGATPTLVVGFLSTFALSAAAESFLVFLNLPWWLLELCFYLPVVVLVICFAYASGWSLARRWHYWFTGILVLLQVFVLATWWPTSFYVVGFTMAAAFALVALVLRQEAQGFISRRSFSRELSLVLVAFVLVLFTARWF